MMLPELSTGQTLDLTYRNLLDNGVKANLVFDNHELPTPVGIHLPGILEADETAVLAREVAKVTYDSPPAGENFGTTVRDTLPIGQYSGALYPQRLLRIADIMVMSATQRPDVRATRVSLDDGLHIAKTDIPMHVDELWHTDDNPPDLLGYSLNLILANECQVTLGAFESYAKLQSVADYAREHLPPDSKYVDGSSMSTKQFDLELAALYERTCRSFGMVCLKAGDGLIHQPVTKSPQRLAVAHRFTSRNLGKRLSAVMRPAFAASETVKQRRIQTISDIKHLGLDSVITYDI